jgi:hypothetical protein
VLALRAEALLYMPGAEDWVAGESLDIETSSGRIGTPPIDPRVWPAMVAPAGSLSWARTMAEASYRLSRWPCSDDDALMALRRSSIDDSMRLCLLGS